MNKYDGIITKNVFKAVCPYSKKLNLCVEGTVSAVLIKLQLCDNYSETALHYKLQPILYKFCVVALITKDERVPALNDRRLYDPRKKAIAVEFY